MNTCETPPSPLQKDFRVSACRSVALAVGVRVVCAWSVRSSAQQLPSLPLCVSYVLPRVPCQKRAIKYFNSNYSLFKRLFYDYYAYLFVIRV